MWTQTAFVNLLSQNSGIRHVPQYMRNQALEAGLRCASQSADSIYGPDHPVSTSILGEHGRPCGLAYVLTQHSSLWNETFTPCTGAGNERQGSSYRQMDMTKVSWNDIGLRAGAAARNVYCHQGCCEHLVVVKDVRRWHPDDSADVHSYPLVIQDVSSALAHKA